MNFVSPIPAARRLSADGAPSAPSADGRAGRRPLVIAAVLLFVGTFLLYLPTLRNDFIYGYDDDEYVMANEVVLRGLTPGGVLWAFTTAHFANWLPVTWLSHMLDVSLFGLNAGGHHATSAVIHAANAVLLLLGLCRLTGRFGPSLAVAVLFAAHPLRVESVAWVAERKDVLAAFFFLLAVLAYARYADRPTAKGYLLVAACHALGLMSKTMLVTLPCVLLLLDWWPLGRLKVGRLRLGGGDRREAAQAAGMLAWEKVPLLALSAVASAWTVVLQDQGGALGFGENLSLGQRAANAVVSIPRYLGKMAVPVDLTIPYVFPPTGSWPVWQVAAAAAVVVAASVAAWLARARMPYLLVGWLWFLGMLLPVSGVARLAGYQAMADRYTYIPGIGVTVAVAWAAAGVLRRWRVSPRVGAVATGVAAVAFGALTVRQAAVWRDEPSLFAHAVAADDGNWLAHSHVGKRLVLAGDVDAGIAHLRRAAELNPRWADLHHNVAVGLLKKGEPDAAVAEYREALRRDPRHAQALYNLGALLLERGRPGEAADVLGRFAEVAPDSADGQLLLSRVLVAAGRSGEAADRLRQATAGPTASADVQVDLRFTLMKAGQLPEAAAAFREAVRLDPGHAKGHFNLGAALAAQGQLPQAVAEYAEAARLKPDWVEARLGLARALGQSGRFEEAEREAAEAARLAPDNVTAARMLANLRARPGRRP
jgi:tetratricopeptide (TPR) repeat protein